jgi:membrane protease YdiL (CAAX protease family)
VNKKIKVLSQILIIYFLSLVLNILIYYLISSLVSVLSWSNGTDNEMAIFIVITIITNILIISLYKANRLPIKYLDNRIIQNKKNFFIYLIMLFTMVGLFISSEFIFSLIGFINKPGEETGHSLFMIWVVALVFAPMYEEYIYRRIFFHHLKTVFNPLFAMIISSLIFSLSHSWGEQALSAFVTSMILCLFYLIYNDMKLVIYGHFLSNALYLVFGYMAKYHLFGIGFNVNKGRFILPTMIIITGVSILSYGIIFCLNIFKKSKTVLEGNQGDGCVTSKG